MKVLAGVCLAMAGNLAFAGEAVYRMTGAQIAVDHVVNGYAQSVTEMDDGTYLVHVSVPTLSIDSNGRRSETTDAWRLSAPSDFDLPASLRSRLKPGLDPYATATEVLRWVKRRLVIDSGDVELQDAASVLRRRRGRCSGVANATAALLMRAGLEARTVSGLLVTDDRAIPHRWVECFLPGAGWVPTDPAAGYWVVTPRHLVFSDTVISLPVVEIVNKPAGTAVLPVLDKGPIRPDRGAELVCRVVGGGQQSIVAVLRDGGGEERRTVLDPEGRFSRLLPGSWIVEIVAGGRIVARQWLELGASVSHSVIFDLDRKGRP